MYKIKPMKLKNVITLAECYFTYCLSTVNSLLYDIPRAEDAVIMAERIKKIPNFMIARVWHSKMITAVESSKLMQLYMIVVMNPAVALDSNCDASLFPVLKYPTESHDDTQSYATCWQ